MIYYQNLVFKYQSVSLLAHEFEMEFITTQKGGKAVLLDGCRYTLNRSMDDGRTYWRYSNRQCSARLILHNSALIEQTGDHSHPVDRCDGIVEKLKSNMKRALEEVTPISSIYNDTLVDIATNYEDVDVAQKMPTFAVVKSSLYRSHQKRLPPIKNRT